MNALFISDLHLTSAPRDEYRWKLFEFLTKFIERNSTNYLFILGDVTDAKDYHSARLVNKVVDNLCALYKNKNAGLRYIYIIGGNHDGTDPTTPYFRFLSQFPFIRFISTPWSEEILGKRFTMLPHSRNPVEDWASVNLHDAEYILAHITVGGAVSESGQQLEGAPASIFRTARRAKIICGDIHVPQTVGDVEYVGSPYRVHFGDTFHPRVMYMYGWKLSSIETDFMQRHTLRINPHEINIAFTDSNLRTGDQVKVELELSRSEYVDWAAHKRNIVDAALQAEVELCGLTLKRAKEKIKIRKKGEQILNTQTPEQIIQRYCEQNKLDPFLKTAALQYLK